MGCSPHKRHPLLEGIWDADLQNFQKRVVRWNWRRRGVDFFGRRLGFDRLRVNSARLPSGAGGGFCNFLAPGWREGGGPGFSAFAGAKPA
jgi:hypothetical protein